MPPPGRVPIFSGWRIVRVPTASPYRRTSRFGFETSPCATLCSGSRSLLVLGWLRSNCQSSRKKRGISSISIDLCGSCLGGGGPAGPPAPPRPWPAIQSAPARHDTDSPNTNTAGRRRGIYTFSFRILEPSESCSRGTRRRWVIVEDFRIWKEGAAPRQLDTAGHLYQGVGGSAL